MDVVNFVLMWLPVKVHETALLLRDPSPKGEAVLTRLLTSRGIALLWMGWTAAVIAGSLLPFNAKHLTHTVGIVHRLVHVVAFAGIALRPSIVRSPLRRKLIASVNVALLGAVLELLQHYYYGNMYEWGDVRDDCIGVIGAIMLGLLVQFRFRKAGIRRLGPGFLASKAKRQSHRQCIR